MTTSSRSLTEFIDDVASGARYPAGVAAAAVSAALALGLFEKALAHPGENEGWKAGQERPVVTALRQRVLELAMKDRAPLEALDRALAMPPGPERAQAVNGARLLAYRSARRLLDACVQGLTLLQSALDYGNAAWLTDLECGARLLVAAQESAIAAAEDHLRELEPAFADSERGTLTNQATQARELATRAEGALSWRRGKV